jgi:hypothetical protein
LAASEEVSSFNQPKAVDSCCSTNLGLLCWSDGVHALRSCEIITQCKKLCCLEYPALLPWWWETRWQNVEVPHLYREFTCNTCTTEHIHALNSSNHLESSTSIPRIAHCFVRLYCVTNSHRGTPSAGQTTRMFILEKVHRATLHTQLWDIDDIVRMHRFIQLHTSPHVTWALGWPFGPTLSLRSQASRPGDVGLMQAMLQALVLVHLPERRGPKFAEHTEIDWFVIRWFFRESDYEYEIIWM